MTRFLEAKETIDYILKQLEGTEFEYWLNNDSIPYDNEEYEDGGINSLYDFMYYGEYPSNIKWAAGATRMVIWDENEEDYVMKIALSESDECYNENEERYYNEAEFADVEEAFAWCSCIYSPDEKYKRGIYAMEYICCDEETLNDESYSYGLGKYCAEMNLDSSTDEAKNKYYDYFVDCCDDNEEVMEYAAYDWGSGLADAVMSFIYDHHINDLHSGNLGYRGSRVVITDYAGY